jgi:hypothetical protein
VTSEERFWMCALAVVGALYLGVLVIAATWR